MRRAAAFAALLLAVLASAVCLYWALSTSSASSAGGLACSVKAADPGCDTGAGEVAVFRMSSLANGHAGTPGGSSYGNVVCCGGVAGLGASCSGAYAAAVTLSALDNAHVASDASYGTKACLSVGAGQGVSCTSGATCGAGFACLATISSTANAHVADCDGANDYATKVCCGASVTGPVGGIAVVPEVSGSSGPNYLALAGLAAAALVALSAGAWYARRRWNR